MSSATAKLEDGISNAERQISSIKNNISRLNSTTPDQRASLDNELDRQIQSLETLLNKMSNDLRSVSGNKDYYEGEIKSLRTQHSEAVAELRQKRLAISNDPNSRQEQQAMLNADRSKGVVNNLDEAIRLGNDTVTTGNAAMATLIDDRKRIENINKNVTAIGESADEGKSKADSIIMRACINGCIEWTIVFLLFLIILYLLYRRFK